MADKDDYDDDGYKFTDPDSMDSPTHGDEYQDEYTDESLNISPTEGEARARLNAEEGRNSIFRKALFVVLIVILAMVGYLYIWPMFSSNNTPPPKPVAQKPQEPVKPVQKQEPVQPVVTPTPVPTVNNGALEAKINILETTQQNTGMELAALNNQLGSVNSNVNTLNAEVAKLSQTISELSLLVNEQAKIITLLSVKFEKKPEKTVVKKKVRIIQPIPVYFLNAVVPGRAWLIAPNGATLTVRVGSSVPGYGLVKLIDAQQGRVLTGSGRVIKFSQEDS